MDVKMEHRLNKTEHLRMALAAVEFGISYQQADLIERVVEDLEKKEGDFSLKDGAKTLTEWKYTWTEYERAMAESKEEVNP